MTSELQEIGSGKNLAARLPEVHLAVILCRVIESIEHHPAQLRNAVASAHASSFEKKFRQ